MITMVERRHKINIDQYKTDCCIPSDWIEAVKYPPDFIESCKYWPFIVHDAMANTFVPRL